LPFTDSQNYANKSESQVFIGYSLYTVFADTSMQSNTPSQSLVDAYPD